MSAQAGVKGEIQGQKFNIPGQGILGGQGRLGGSKIDELARQTGIQLALLQGLEPSLFGKAGQAGAASSASRGLRGGVRSGASGQATNQLISQQLAPLNIQTIQGQQAGLADLDQKRIQGIVGIGKLLASIFGGDSAE